MMASSKIKGITIEIGGNTTKLQDALKGVDKQVYSLNGDLKALNQALKLDPKNTELLAQKQDVLRRNIQATAEKLNTLKEAQRQMGDYNKLTDEQKESYNQLSLEIAKSEKALKSMNDELKNTHKHDFSQLQAGLKKVGEVAVDVSKKVLQISVALTGAIAGVVTAGVKKYAELEKAQKGSERLFGNSFKTVEKNAAKAYKTMGLSATEYYDQVNTYAVGLKNALGGDAEKSAQLANSILEAQADIVAATGASQEQVQSAFAAVMRGNYTMIDNLRLGIKGSKEGMQEVIDKVNEWNKEQGNATHYQMGNYADMQQALVDYTKMTGVAGTAQKQMSATISGSLTQMKAAWTNFISGVGSAKDFSKTLSVFMKNIFNAVKKLAPEIINGLVELLNDLIPELVNMIAEILPILINGVKSLIDGIIDFINNDSEQFINMAVDLLTNLATFILQNLPLLLQASIKIVAQLASGIAKSLPELIPVMVDSVLLMVDTIIDNIDLIIDAGIDIIIALIDGIIVALPRLVDKIPEIIDKLVNAIVNNLPKILKAGFQIILKLGEGLIQAIPDLVLKIPQIISSIVKGLKEGISEVFNVGKMLIQGLWDGMKSLASGAGSWLWGKVKGIGSSIVGWFKGAFGIASPSKVMRDQIGKNLGLGLAKGIDDTVGDVENAMSNLSSKVETSVNPVINPTANSNPLYVTIDKFYNNRDTDVQQLAEELEFYRKNSALAKGGV